MIVDAGFRMLRLKPNKQSWTGNISKTICSFWECSPNVEDFDSQYLTVIFIFKLGQEYGCFSFVKASMLETRTKSRILENLQDTFAGPQETLSLHQMNKSNQTPSPRSRKKNQTKPGTNPLAQWWWYLWKNTLFWGTFEWPGTSERPRPPTSEVRYRLRISSERIGATNKPSPALPWRTHVVLWCD